MNIEPRATAAERLRLGTAYHEAGHAAVAVHFQEITRQALKTIAITLDEEERLGFCERFFDDPDSLRMRIETGDEDLVRAEIMISLAGDLAEEKAGFGDTVISDKTPDIIEAVDLAAKLVCPDLEAELGVLSTQTRELLADPRVWAGVERLAAELLRVSVVTGERAYELFGAVEMHDRDSAAGSATGGENC